jgi:formylglycine-generating enzyme required for sulfatase activity
MNQSVREHGPDESPMVLVPAGTFLMGLPDNDFLAEEHEKPQRTVHLSAFWIDIYPVTNARFARFLEAGGYADPAWWSPAGWAWRQQHGIRRPLQWGQAGWDGGDQPVAGVSWYEAAAYASWAGRRLPTDAEWEKAARGTDGRRYPWGNEWPLPALANFALSVGRTTPVGLYPQGASPYGCHDMGGNVNNWTADWYWEGFGRCCVQNGWLRDPCLGDLLRERLQARGNAIDERADRGGGFATPQEFQEVLGCTRKVHWPPEAREPWNGFRTALSAAF